MSHATSKLDNIRALEKLYLAHPEGITDAEAAQTLGINFTSIYRYRTEDMQGIIKLRHGVYTWKPTREQYQHALLIVEAYKK